MAGETITREEYKAGLEVQVKLTEQLVTIAGCMKQILDNESTIIGNQGKIMDAQNKISDKMADGLKDDIADKVEEKLKNSDIAKSIERIQWFVGIIGIVIIIANVVLTGFDRRVAFKNEIQQLIQVEKLQNSALIKLNQGKSASDDVKSLVGNE